MAENENKPYEKNMEFVIVRRFRNLENDEDHCYAGVIKDGTYYGSEDNLGDGYSYSDLKSYSTPEACSDIDYDIPDDITDLASLADYILDEWADIVIEDDYEVSDNEYIMDFWKGEEIVYQKKFYKE